MTLMKKIEKNASNLNKVLKEINSKTKEDANAIDKEWFDFLQKQGKLNTNGKVYTASQAVSEAKKQKERIMYIFAKSSAEKQLELIKKLTYLNNIIVEYESKFNDKENAKKQITNYDAAAKKANAVKDSINDSISKIDEELEQLKTQFEEIKNDFSFSGESNNKELLKELSKIEKQKAELLEFKKCLTEIITLKDEKNYLVKATAKLSKKYYPAVEFYYNIIKANSIDMRDVNIEIKPKKDDNPTKNLDEIRGKINELLNKVRTEKNLGYLDEVLKLIEELEDEKEKEEFLKQIKEIEESFKKNGNEFYKKAMELFDVADNSGLFIDFNKAVKFVKTNKEQLEEFKEEIETRIRTTINSNTKLFEELLAKLEEKISKQQLLEENEMVTIKDKYQFLRKNDAEYYRERLNNVISVYNMETQEIDKTNYNQEEDKKYGFFARVSEFFGKGITLLSGTKVAYNISKKRLEKALEKFNNAEDEEEKEHYQEKIEKIENTLVQQDTASGVRLYSARNYIRKIKPKLYSNEELTNHETKKLERSQRNIINKVSKKLNKVTNREDINEIKVRVINVLDQYVEMLATCYFDYNKVAYFEEEVQKAKNFLYKSRDILTPEEFSGYEDQIILIYNYRTATDGNIYELSMREDENGVSYEVDSIIENSYLDANVYKNSCSHVLRRK